jgi:hypothetical protein
LEGNPEGKRLLGRSRCSRVKNIMYIYIYVLGHGDSFTFFNSGSRRSEGVSLQTKSRDFVDRSCILLVPSL